MAVSSLVLLAICIYLLTFTATFAIIEIPAKCHEKEFCEVKPKGYHHYEKQMNRLLKKYNLKALTNNFNDRMGWYPQNVDISDNCPSLPSEYKPFIIKDKNTTNVDILVQTRIFSQTVETVTCDHNQIGSKKHNQQCFSKLGLNFWNFNCREVTAIRSLLIYDPQRNIIKNKNYTIPVCCRCLITSD